MPGKGFVSRLGQAPKRQVADPALAARLLKLDADALKKLYAARDMETPTGGFAKAVGK